MGPADLNDAARDRLLLDSAERVGGLGSWEWRPATRELRWSDNHFRLFGVEPGSIEPSPEFVIEHTHADDRERVADVVDALRAAGDVSELEYRIIRADGETRHLRTTISVLTEEPDRVLVGSLQDITDRRVDERAIATRTAISRVLDNWHGLQHDATTLLAAFGEPMHFAFGALMVHDEGYMSARAVWVADPRFEAAAPAAALRRPIGASDAGRAWSSSLPVIAAFEASARPPSPLRKAAEEAGVQTTVAVPAVTGTEAVAVLAFMTTEHLAPSDGLVRSLVGVGHELGHFFAQRRGELEAPVLTARGLDVLQLAARGLSRPEIAAELGLSPATVKRHFEDIYARLGLSDRAAAVAEAMRRGLIS